MPWPSSDTSVLLSGSLGSYVLKIDRTQPTNTKSVYLRAITRGLKHIDQQLEWVICPQTGGVTVVPPSEYLPKTFEATTGIKLTLPEKALYKMIDVGSTGTTANLPFNQWAISDAYEGCGVFWKYGITANSTTLPFLQYPQPGYTLSVHCTAIASCLQVRVTDTTAPKQLHFEL